MWVTRRSFMPNLQQADSFSFDRTPRWYAIHTRYQNEQAVAKSLLNKGFCVFLPTYNSLHRWSDRKKLVTLPLFPGYLFFADEISRWIQILSTPGVNAIIRIGNVPAEIPNDEVVAIRRVVESTLCAEPHPFLSSGDLVRIRSGPLEGLEGIVSRKKDALRLVLSIRILGQSAAVEIDGCVVERVGPPRPIVPDHIGWTSRNPPAPHW
jgi:transcription antitermination factor NusG